MVLLPPCLFSGEQNEHTIICRNDIISTCKKIWVLSAGVTSEFSAITNCPYVNNQSKWRYQEWKIHNNLISVQCCNRVYKLYTTIKNFGNLYVMLIYSNTPNKLKYFDNSTSNLAPRSTFPGELFDHTLIHLHLSSFSLLKLFVDPSQILFKT